MIFMASYLKHCIMSLGSMDAMELTQAALERVLGFKVIDFSKYITVFTHKSAMRITHGESYERLEFIGDSIIGFVVAVMLFESFPQADEGVLTRLRTKLVSRDCLASLAWHMGLHRFVMMNQRSMQHGFNENPRILEDVFESLVACIYLDLGMAAAKTFLLSTLQKYVNFHDIVRDTNYKDGLMRYAQARGMPLPEYLVMNTAANSHAAFLVRARLGSACGQGVGPSKKQAEQAAAQHLLHLLGGLTSQGDVKFIAASVPVGNCAPSRHGSG